MSLLMVRKSAPAHAAINEFNRLVNPAKDSAADASEVQRVEKLLKRELTDAEFWKLGDYVMKNLKAGRTFTDAELLKAVKDCAADADKSEELEREIKGDVVAVVSGNAARVSKDVSFATAKEGVESFARKNGVSVVASQEYGEAYKFKFSAAIDCATDAADAAAQDRGNYATNTIALLRTALGNIRTADSVVRRAISNIGDAMDKVKDERAKSSLKSMQQEWWACEREIWAALEKVERVSVPSGVGVPNKQKLSPEDRKFIEEFFE